MNACIIGSFQKYYNDILNVIECFEENGINILSPKHSSIERNENGFVILKSDYNYLQHDEIELMVFHRMFQSDFVYVWNPGGYIGKTTCYEIGRAEERGLTIFFKEIPVDLPVFISNDAIVSPENLCGYIMRNQKLPILYYPQERIAYKLSDALKNKHYYKKVDEVYDEDCNFR